MDEAAALRIVGEMVGAAGDDAAVVDGLVVTTDMLHERADFPAGTTRYTAGWRSVGASLSDVAAMGAAARAAVAVYAAPTLLEDELRSFLRGATAVCDAVDAAYVGGDLDTHQEFTVATAAIGETDEPVGRSGAAPGDRVYVTGTLGRTGAALWLFDAGKHDRANDLFRFTPRVAAGRRLADAATAMMDSSDGLARTLHTMAAASGCGFRIDGNAVPIDPVVHEVAADEDEVDDLGLFVGEDFELVCTASPSAIEPLEGALDVPLTEIGRVTDDDVRLDDDPLPDRGYTHGSA